MPEVNAKQAMVPEGATVLPNARGTAPGLWIPSAHDKIVVLLPGPPRELQPMFEEHVEARLRAKAAGVVYDVRKIWIAGLAESVVEERTAACYRAVTNPSTTVLASGGQIELRLTAHGPTPAEARRANESLAKELRALLGDSVFSESEESLEQVVGQLLLKAGQRITVAESLTGGLIADRLTDVAGASRYFDVGYVTYSNAAKTELLGVPSRLLEKHGAVSEEVAEAMARGARERARSDIALAVTGIAGPSGGSDAKPVGLTYIALAAEKQTIVRRFQFPGERARVKRFTSTMALDLVRKHLL